MVLSFFVWYPKLDFSSKKAVSGIRSVIRKAFTCFSRELQDLLLTPLASLSLGFDAATTAKYCITRFVFSVLPAPDSPLYINKKFESGKRIKG